MVRNKRKLDKRSDIVGETFNGIFTLEVTDKIKWNAKVFRFKCHCGKEPPKEGKVNRSKTYTYSGISNGIDRKNNSRGYSIINCVPCCTTCNMMKKTLGYEEFLEHCNKITINTIEKVTKALKK